MGERPAGNGAQVLVQRALGEGVTPKEIEKGHAFFLTYYRAHMLDNTVAYPGVREALERLKDRELAVLTNKPADMSAAIVDGLGLGEMLPRIVGGDSLPVRKPDPSGLRSLIAAAGVDVAATLMVGDSAIDVATGKNAGVATCGVLWGFSGRSVEDAGADVLIATPAELEPVVRLGITSPSR